VADSSASEERKIISVLFADLVGFTARSHHADPEDVRAALDPYHAALKQEIERLQGRVEKFVGDAVMAVFGVPKSREDDAERAVRAGLKVLKAVEELNESRPGLDLAVRVAVDTGEAIVSLRARPHLGDMMVTGDVVNTASRLQQVAPVGGLIIGERTYRATKSHIDYGPRRQVDVKGKPEPLPVWQALAPRSRTGVEPDRAEGPLVGRSHEMVLLSGVFRRAVAEASPQLITIVGEAGVGKSRLIAELRRYIDDLPELVAWMRAGCPSSGSSRFGPLEDVLRAHTGVKVSDGPDVALERLRRAVEVVIPGPQDREWFIAMLSPLVGAAGRGPRKPPEDEELFSAWLQYIEAIAVQRPLVLVFDDVHWADMAMLEFIEQLAGWATGVPLLVVCAARPELIAKYPGWGGGLPNSTTIALSGLSEPQTVDLLRVVDPRLDGDAARTLAKRSGGNPLYAEELVYMLAETGALDELATHPIRPVTIQVPESLQLLIAARVDALDPAEKRVLQDAAVIGRTFWIGALSELNGWGAIEERRRLHELVRRQLVAPVRNWSIEGQAEFMFVHSLVQEVAYAQVPRSERVSRHLAAARWLESVAPAGIDERAEIIARHLSRAMDNSPRAGDGLPSEVRVRCHDYFVMAARRLRIVDVQSAASCYRRALDVLPDRPEHTARRASAVLGAAEADWLCGKVISSEAQKDCERAIEALLEQGEKISAGEAMVQLAHVLWDSDPMAARSKLERAVHLLDTRGGERCLAAACADAAGYYWVSGAPEQSIRFADRAIELSQSLGLEEELVRAKGFRGAALAEKGDRRGLQDLREALQRAQALGLAHDAAVHFNNLGWNQRLFEGPRAALEVLESGISFSERRGLGRDAGWMRVSRIEVLVDLGEWDEALVATAAALAADSGVAGTHARVHALVNRAMVLAWRGALGREAGVAAEALEGARSLGDPALLSQALCMLWLMERGVEDDAPRSVGAELAEVITEDCDLGLSLWHAVAMLVRTGHPELASQALDSAPSGTPRHLQVLLHSRAELAEAAGDLSAAVSLYDAAIGGYDSHGLPLWQAVANIGAARCLISQDRRAEAAGRLDRALAAADRLDGAHLRSTVQRLRASRATAR
jgi:class 3 adenylate cyclase/tetratricopeptide (TPR) repeat protein